MRFETLDSEGPLIPQLRELAASTEPVEAARGQKLLDLVEYLESRGPTPAVGACLFDNQLWISLRHPNRRIYVWVDWQDRPQLQNGLPVMHYRLQIRKGDDPLTEDFRFTTTIEAACAIFCA